MPELQNQADRSSGPLVSIVTPVRNGVSFIRECIESVQGQDFRNYEHIILDNCSSDHTAEVAERYAAKDHRIRVMRNTQPVPMIRNWNLVLEAISPESRWCKTLHGDDYLYDGCLTKMVEAGESDPRIGIVGSLRNRGARIECNGLGGGTFDGREIGRLYLGRKVFAIAPTSGMIRTDLVRARKPFYPEHYLHADTAVYLDMLHATRYGFINEVLAFSRVHAASVTATIAERRQTIVREWLLMLDEFGPRYFDPYELVPLKQAQIRLCLRTLAKGILRGESAEFIDYHLSVLQGRPLTGAAAMAVRLFVRIADQRRTELHQSEPDRPSAPAAAGAIVAHGAGERGAAR